MSKLYVIGDSTVSSFNDVTYYYPRFGYGALLNEYFDIEIINLALSGRSSRSFIVEDNYKYLFDNLKKDDYVLIGFGHNDEKSDDSFRFSDASLPIDNPLSFKYVLYNSYIKRILEIGAYPILTTPVVRLSPNDKYENEFIHVTPTGDYHKAIVELAKEYNLLCVDITEESLKLVKALGFKNALPLHAMTKGKFVNDKLTYDEKSVDKTHLSYYGAKMNAYLIANSVLNSNLGLKKYLVKDIKMPTLDELKPNPQYVFKKYITPDLNSYKPSNNFDGKDYYGTAFGSLGTTEFEKAGFIAKEENGSYLVGQTGDKLFGRINASTEGIAFLFKRINRSDNFIFKADVEVVECADVRQSAFGLMLRGDAYINQDTPNQNIVTNNIVSGLLTTDRVTYAIFARSTTTDLDRIYTVREDFYKKGDKATLKLERLGQVVKVTTIYNGKEYYKEFIDYDYYNDEKYLFVGMIGTNGTVAKYTNVSLEITGKAIEA